MRGNENASQRAGGNELASVPLAPGLVLVLAVAVGAVPQAPGRALATRQMRLGAVRRGLALAGLWLSPFLTMPLSMRCCEKTAIMARSPSLTRARILSRALEGGLSAQVAFFLSTKHRLRLRLPACTSYHTSCTRRGAWRAGLRRYWPEGLDRAVSRGKGDGEKLPAAQPHRPVLHSVGQ